MLTSDSNTKLRTENLEERPTGKTRGDITIYLRDTNSETVYYTRWTTKRNDQLRVQGTSSSGSITSTYWPNDYYINFKRTDPYVCVQSGCLGNGSDERPQWTDGSRGHYVHSTAHQKSYPSEPSEFSDVKQQSIPLSRPVHDSPFAPLIVFVALCLIRTRFVRWAKNDI